MAFSFLSAGLGLANSLMSKKGSSSSKGSSNTFREPYGPAIPGLKTIGSMAEGIADTPLNYHSSVTGFNPDQERAMQLQRLGSGRVSSQVVEPAMQAYQSMLNPMDVVDNPMLRGAMGALTDQFTQDMNLKVLPGLRTSANMADPTGGISSRRALTEGTATGLGLQGLAREQAGMTHRAFQDALGQQRFGLGFAPQMAGLHNVPSEMLQDIGDRRWGLQDAQAQDEVARKRFEQDEPYLRAQRAMGLLRPLGMMGGTSTGQTRTEGQQGGRYGGAIKDFVGGGLAGGSFFGGGGGVGGQSYNPGIGYYDAPDLGGGMFPGSYGR